MKKKVINILVVIFTIGVIYEVYNYVKELNTTNTNKVLEEIQISDNLKGSKQIAIKQQDVDFTWKDMGTSMDAWPDINTFEYYGSECIDASGKAITPTTSVIQFNEQNQTATISTSKTIYCTLKFARRSTVLKLMQQTTDAAYLKTVASNDELLRYVGTQSSVTSNKINNFICFGTENKDTCLNNKETYMYRIIGITTDKVNTGLGLEKNQLKIIKAVPNADGKGRSWTGGSSTWDSASVNTGYLNDANSGFIKTIKDIKTKVGTHTWEQLISNPKWYIADNGSTPWSLKTEANTTTLSGNLKIGLMYASDYYNSGSQNTNNWLHITNGMSGSTTTYSSINEWTMTRYMAESGGLVWNVYAGGGLDWRGGNYSDAVRPVFYLTNEISISGQGIESDPFIISLDSGQF